MLEKEKFNIYEYVKKEEYCGSMSGMRYRLIKLSPEEMEVTIWPEPYGYGHTDESLKIRKTFPFSREGVEMARVYLNEMYESNKALWVLR